MKMFVALYSFLIIFQLSIAATTFDPTCFGNSCAIVRLRNMGEGEVAPMKFTRRDLTEFGLMIICHVGKSPLEYGVSYGCFCGLGGKGEPQDDTDRCCQVHDECYTSVQNSGDCPFDNSVYVMPYGRKNCYQCEPASYYWFYGKCRHALCKCDSEAVQCFKRSKYNPELKNYPQDKC